MKLVKVIILLALVVVVFGGAALAGYLIFLKPAKLDRADAIAAETAPPPTPPPDYSLAAFDTAMAAVKTGTPDDGREALRNFIAQYPKSTAMAKAKATLGDLNMDGIYLPSESSDEEIYTVVSGDSLVRVASRTKSNAELILRANNLLSINLSIGQKLRIPQVAMAIFVDRQANTLTLLDGGNFFKEYPVLSLRVPGAAGTPIDTKVTDKIALRGADRVAFGAPNYPGSERWIMLGDGIVIRSAPPTEDGSPPVNLPPGIILAPADMEEIFPLVSRDNAVTIQ